MNIGLTGGIACGKSTVSAMLVNRGAILVDADLIAREVVLPGSPILGQLAQRFGSVILRPDGSLDRKMLGSIVFADTSARKEMEAMMHPAIRAVMKQRTGEYESDYPNRLVIVDVPLLFESKLQSMFNEVMLVYVPRKVQIERLILRDKLTAEQADERLLSQMPIDEKRSMADYIIDNSGTLKDTSRQIDLFWNSKGLT